MRWTPLVLGALLLVVQADLWFGKGNLPYAMSLHAQLAEQQAGAENHHEMRCLPERMV